MGSFSFFILFNNRIKPEEPRFNDQGTITLLIFSSVGVIGWGDAFIKIQGLSKITMSLFKE